MSVERRLLDVLLLDYNTYRQKTHHIFQQAALHGRHMRTFLKAKPDRMDALEQMVVWCRARQVEPRLWLYFLFACRGWRFPPMLTKGALCSEKMLAKFGKRKALDFFVAHTMENPVTAPAGYDPNRDLTSGVEAHKAKLLAESAPHTCRSSMLTETLGYHPQSKHCARCPEARACVLELESLVPFSMVAVRIGRLRSEDAERQSRQRG